MQPLARNLVGSLTSVFWLVAGTYMIFNGIDRNWRLVGYAVVAVGVVRAALLIRDWNKRKRPDD